MDRPTSITTLSLPLNPPFCLIKIFPSSYEPLFSFHHAPIKPSPPNFPINPPSLPPLSLTGPPHGRLNWFALLFKRSNKIFYDTAKRPLQITLSMRPFVRMHLCMYVRYDSELAERLSLFGALVFLFRYLPFFEVFLLGRFLKYICYL